MRTIKYVESIRTIWNCKESKSVPREDFHVFNVRDLLRQNYDRKWFKSRG